MAMWPIPSLGSMNRYIPTLAYAIGKAEGFGPPNNIPTIANNPGDLELGDIGFGTLGNITIYPTFARGCQALYHELDLIISGNSKEYSVFMTFSQIAVIWTGNDNPIGWAATVSKILNVFPATTIQGWIANHA